MRLVLLLLRPVIMHMLTEESSSLLASVASNTTRNPSETPNSSQISKGTIRLLLEEHFSKSDREAKIRGLEHLQDSSFEAKCKALSYFQLVHKMYEVTRDMLEQDDVVHEEALTASRMGIQDQCTADTPGSASGTLSFQDRFPF